MNGTELGWRIFRSDKGRLWATREQSFDKDAEHAGASRTVDGDDRTELHLAIAEQESIAALAARPSQ